MTERKTSVRVLSLLLAVCMLAGMLPLSALAAETTVSGTFSGGDETHYLMFATDRHANTTIIGSLLTQMESAVGDGAIEYVGLGGDMVGAGSDSNPVYDVKDVLDEVTAVASNLDNTAVDLVYASGHDQGYTDPSGTGIMNKTSGLLYEGEDYYVYGVIEDDVKSADNAQTASAAFVTWANGGDIDTSKVIILLSHFPLHALRGDNLGAGYWHTALNAVATGTGVSDKVEIIRDVVFFHGHNHSQESTTYLKAPGSTLSIESLSAATGVSLASEEVMVVYDNEAETYASASGTEATIYYTYATAGYLNAQSKATLFAIDDASFSLTVYNTGGATADTLTIDRLADESVTPVTLEVTGESAYVLGDTFAEPTVTVKYSDGTSRAVTGYTVEGTVDTSTAGEYALTYSYTEGGYAASAVFTVNVVSDADEDQSVVGESAEFEVPESETQPVTSTTTTTTTKTVYVLTSSISSGNSYLIVNSNSASSTTRYALANNNGSVAATGVTVKSGDVDGDGDTETYIELDDAADELWTVDGSYTFKNGNYYLGYTMSGSGKDRTYSFGLYTNSRTWEYSSRNSRLSIEAGNTTYYLRYNNGWSWTNDSNASGRSVYFYLRTEVEEETTTEINGTYSIEGNPAKQTVTVAPGDTETLALGSTLIFTSGGTSETTENPSGVKYERYDADGDETNGYTGDPNGIISSISGNTVTFTGNTGKALIKVTYTGTAGSTSYTVTNYIQITATRRNYQITIIADGTEPGSTLTVTQDSTLDLSGTTITYVDGNGDTQTVTGESITWSITDDNENIDYATIENGVVTVDNVSGTATVTATWTDPYGNTITDTLTLEIVDAIWSLNIESPVLDENNNYVIAKDSAGNELKDIKGDPYYATTDITAPIVVKDVVPNQTNENVWAVITKNGVNIGTLSTEEGADYPLSKLTFTSSDESIATVDATTGKVTFTGKSGTVVITAMYEYAEGMSVTDSVVFSVSDSHYYVPEDGTDDFPEYPNEGAIRFDKTATAVGNFSETGITQVELSMTGVPYTVGNEMDVVVMLDMTGSMSDNGMEAAEEATKAFVELIVKNEDGTYNDNRVAVYAFNSGSSSPYELVALSAIKSDAELTTANTAIDTASDKQSSGGTPFDEAAEKCYDVLKAAKTDGTGDERQQFCVFMSDGGPTTYYGSDQKTYYGGNNNSGDVLLTSCMEGYSSETSTDWRFTLPTEYYTDQMKADGVTVYTVGLLLQTAPSNPAPYSSMTDSTYDSTTDSLTTIGSHYYFTSSILKQMATDTSKYIDIFNVDNADNATDKFQAIAKSILEAAKDVKVEDKMADAFTMVFEAPNATVAAADGDQEYYIEVKDYALTPVKDANGNITDYTRGNAQSLMKLYLGTKDNTYYAASDASGTPYAAPVFSTTALGTKYYWTTDSTKASSWPTGEYDSDGNEITSGISVTVSDTTYYFTSDGNGTHNLTSGAYASGTITEETITKSDGTEDTNSTSQDLIIATPYFVYNAATKVLVWTVEELSNTELALSYFLYLDHSGGWEGSDQAIQAGTYETNGYADLTYSNFNENECEQTLPVPQITWNGAQVSYVFYLVNDAGQPVNRAGRVVPFSEAVYVTDVFTYSITWNNLEQAAGLEAERLATDLVPDVYELFDNKAEYRIHVYEDEKSVNLNNHFVIVGSTEANTTYVFNTKADTVKYITPGTYIANDGDDSKASTTYLCKSDSIKDAVYTTANGVHTVTAATYVPVDGETQWAPGTSSVTGGTVLDGYVYYVDENGDVYTIVQKSDASEVREGFDFSNTTVAFAVKWKPELVPDVVVIDYGLDVVIDVATNDTMASGVVGVRTDAPDTTINTGTYTNAAKVVSTAVKIGGLEIGTASVESLTSVRFSLNKTNGMQLTQPITFYYETEVNYYSADSKESDNTLITTSMYSSVTVIPATTVYYEDSFITFSDEWGTDGQTVNATQAQDRPGQSQISAALDADNLYGYDGAYTNMSMHSMGSARKVTLNSTNISAEASFTFYGTGFDVISMTSNTTGTLIVDVFPGGDASGTAVKSLLVDTYFGYEQKEDGTWGETSSTNPNALYQVPVMAVSGLTYGKYYVRITALYNEFFDHVDGSYDVYLDAIRIYDPTGVVAGTTDNDTGGSVSDAYVDDLEAWPVYEELRNNVISAADFASGQINGITFIDGIPETASVADYVSFGPNNELYLAPGQAIVFSLDLDDYVDAEGKSIVKSVHLGIKSADGTPVDYVICGGDSLTGENATVDDLTGSAKTTVSTATDMYYDITDLKDNVIVIYNAAGGILSLTNIKITFTQAHRDVSELFYVDYDLIMAIIENLQKITSGDIDSGSGSEEDSDAFDPAVTVYYPVNVYAGKDFTVTVVTSADVTSVRIGEAVITEYAENEDTRERQWAHTLKATTEAVTQDIIVTAYGADDAESATVTVTANVILDAEMTVNMPVFVNTQETFTIDVTTNTDVTKLKVNDTEYTAYTDVDGARLWSVSYTASATDGTEVIQVIAYNENQVASEPVVAEVEVAAFAPTVSVVPAAISVNSGEVIQITVKTSSDVESVSVNGQQLTTYRTDSNGERVWTADVVAEKDNIVDGMLQIKVVAYDDDGRPFAAQTVEVKVTEMNSSGSDTIKGIIKTIVSKLRELLGW